MWIEKLEEQYRKHENVVKAVASLSLGMVLGMWAYGKYKESKTGKIVDKGLEIEKKIENLSQEVEKIKEEVM